MNDDIYTIHIMGVVHLSSREFQVRLVLRLLPGPSHCLHQIFLSDLLPA